MARFGILIVLLTIAASADAEAIRGAVIIKQRLTKVKVTAPTNFYERGPVVELRSDSQNDPLADERARVVVYLEGNAGGSQTSTPRGTAEQAAIEQKERRFVPELLVVPVGSTVSLIFHNVFSLSKPKSFDLGNYPRNQTRTVTFLRPGIEFVNCHLHPNMSATIVITPNPWHATADRAGNFVIHGVPAGSYNIVAWHKAAGYFRQSVKVMPDHGASVEFFVPLNADGAPAGGIAKLEARH